MGDPAWLTWPEAADLVGCPIPTIDWYTRQGRIKTRPRHGNRPTVNRKSAEEFADWWRQRQADKERRRAEEQRRRSAYWDPPGPGWIRSDEAAEILGVTQSHVARLAKSVPLENADRARWMWLKKAQVRALAAKRAQWVSMRQASRMVGCTERIIQGAVKRGEIKQRAIQNHAVPSLDRMSVEAFSRRWRDTRATRA